MKSNEFRIGNWIDRGDCICRITAIDRDGIMTEPISSERVSDIQELKPLPIKRITKGCSFSDGRKNLDIRFEDGFWLAIYSENIGMDYQNLNIDFEYIHELQNLYYVLFGKELNLEL